MIYHIHTARVAADPDTSLRMIFAQQTWIRQPWIDFPISDDSLPRLWIEGDRVFPYLRDLFDAAVRKCREADVILYTNADILVRSDCCARVERTLLRSDACYCFRRDFHHRIDCTLADIDYAKGLFYPGADLFAFRPIWWSRHRQSMPDMLVGNEAYDLVLRTLIDETNLGRQTRIDDLIAYWEDPMHRYSLRSQLHNLQLASSFFFQRGIARADLLPQKR